MCGISGIVSFKTNLNLKKNFDAVASMNRSIKHRGPDHDQVKKISEQCIFGHVRLSIIDLSNKSNQPMTSSCKRYSIVFNGEIYNFKDIKNKYKLITKSTGDTEVLLEAFAKVGASIIKELNGIFAFAIYDNKEKKLTLVRDRFGVKPLYYSVQQNNIYFSSEIKALTSLSNIKKIFNETKLSDYFTFLTLPDKDTFFKEIYKVMPGEILNFKKETNKSSIFSEPVEEFSNFSEITKKKLYKEFINTVKRHSVSDVQIGLFLSGGVDSNSILESLLINKSKPEVFTAYFESDHDSYSSELNIVEKVAKKNNLNLYRVKITRDLFWSNLDNIILHQDEPLSDPVNIPVYFLSKELKKNNLKVVHVGEGADEIFFGYHAWRKLELLQYSQYIQKFLSKTRILNLFKIFSYLFNYILPVRYSEVIRRFLYDLPIFWGGTDALTFFEKKNIGINLEFLKNTDNFIKKKYKIFLEKYKDISPNKWMTYFDLKVRLPELMLMRVDKMTMAFGIEARVPFLDNRLANIAWNIDIEQKRTKESTKHIFKKAFEDHLPSDLLYAKKIGFNAPAEEWSNEEFSKVFREIELFCKHSKLLNFNEIKKLCLKAPRHTWRFYVLSRWYNLNFN